MTGTYTIVLDPSGTYTGSVTFTLCNVADVTGTITIGGSAVNVTITTPGQNGSLTFSGSAGQRVSLLNNSSTIGCGYSVRNILKPDGTTLVSGNLCNGNFTDIQILPVTGTYTIVLDPDSTYTGTVTMTLYSVPADVTGTITIGGSAVNVTITTPGQNGSLTFNGTASQQVTVRITSNTAGSINVALVRQNGTTILTQVTSGAASFNLATQTLPATETYTVKINPTGANTGSMNVSVTSP